SASPLLAILAEEGDDNELARVLQQRASQVAGLLHETSRLTVALAEQAGLAIDGQELTDGTGSSFDADSRGRPRGRLVFDSPELLAEDREIERLLHSLQTALADRAAKAGRGLVPPGDYLGYEAVIRGVQSAVEETVPPRAAVAVISRGDDELVRLRDRSGMHLPQTERGTYAGYHPADSAEAVRHLEDAQARGADFLVVPSASFWWLEHYREFAEALDRDHECVHRGEACAIYRLAERRVAEAI
ncbi:MAG: hypothetical protein M3303_03400, partial [Gemmatimonadota bacterium]|nr:hypothetical protein [Gemmatimonadota bacterium]